MLNECKQESHGKLNTLGIYEKEYAEIRMAQSRICTQSMLKGISVKRMT